MALKITWVKRFLNNTELNIFVNAQLGDIGDLFWKCNLKKADVKEGIKYLKNEFLLNVVCSWSDYNYSIPNTKNEILYQVLWLNFNIRIDNKVVYYKTWEKKGIVYVKDILNNNYEFMSHVEITKKLVKQTFYIITVC